VVVGFRLFGITREIREAMKSFSTTAGILAPIALLLLTLDVASGQPKVNPRLFFESAKKSLDLKDVKFLQPTSGTAMKQLTSVQSVQDLRSFMATADSVSLTTVSDDIQVTAAEDKLQRFLRDSSLQSIQLVALDIRRVESSLFADAKVKLCEGVEPYCSTVRSKGWEKKTGRVEQMFVTLGTKGEGKPTGQAIFVREDADIRGVLNVGTQTYVMRQLLNRVFAITTSRRDEIERSKDDVLDLKRGSKDWQKIPPKTPKPPQIPSGSSSDACPNPATTQVVEVLVVSTVRATNMALEAGDSMRQLVKTAQAIANVSFENSNIKGEIHVIQLGTTKYKESGDFHTDIQELLKDGGRLEHVREARRKTKADVAVLIVDHPSRTNCGMAAGISVPKERAFAVVNWKCITDKFSFIHEIGHLAGAWHDPVTVGSGYVVDPPYAHGYVTVGKEPMATIMAYRESCHAPCGRRWYWSNPHTRTEDGQVLGTADKNFDACVWRQRLPEMATFNGG